MRSRTAAPALACLALLFASAPARAQVLLGYLFGEKLASPTFNMGFEVGANFTNLEGLSDGARTNRPVFGLFADWRFSENFHLGGAVLPIAARGAEDLAPVPTGDPAFDSQTAGRTMRRGIDYVEIPVLLKWAPNREEGIRVGAGPSLGILTGANDRYDCVTPAGLHYVLENDIGHQLPGLDFGLSFEVEWRLKILSIAARYTEGLTDMSQDGSPDAVHTRALTGTGRIYLGRKP
jgi:outer membrane protein with beta-barrel domain